MSMKLNPVLFLSSSLFCVYIRTLEPLPCIRKGGHCSLAKESEDLETGCPGLLTVQVF